MKLSTSEWLSYTTVRIICERNDGTGCAGTGFIFNFLEDKEKRTVVPVIITNKHVVKNATKGIMVFTKAKPDGSPSDTEHFQVEWDNFESSWKMHPDNSVDLCALLMAPIIMNAKARGVNIFYHSLYKDVLMTEATYESINALEEILMVGYPNGLWDEKNNKPIFRRGITASHPKYDYNGKKEIIIDAACFPGSSGSPVFIFNEGVYKPKNKERLIAGDRVILIGVLHAGPQYTVTGQIEVVPIANLDNIVSKSQNMLNLGYVIKAERILEMEDLFK